METTFVVQSLHMKLNFGNHCTTEDEHDFNVSNFTLANSYHEMFKMNTYQ